MTSWYSASLNNAAVVTLLAGSVWALSRVVRRPEVIHTAWILVLAKLIAPPLIPLPVPITWPSIEAPFADRWSTMLITIWVTGSVIVGILFVKRGIAFRRLIRRYATPSADAQQHCDVVSARLGLRHSPRILMLDACTTPLVWGLGRAARVVFPTGLWESASPNHRQAMLLHELAHIRRGDHAVRLLEAMAMLLYWWHPVVWMARREIEDSEEECCDARALAEFDPPPRDYAEALLSAIDFASHGWLRPLLGTGVRPTQRLSRRLTRIMLRSGELRLPRTMRVCLFLAAMAALPLYPLPSPDFARHDAKMTFVTASSAPHYVA
jgi:bla regulator protein blaR1